MEPAEARPPAELFENVDAFEAAAAEYPEADHAEPQSAAAQPENGAGADIEGAPPEGLNGLPLSKSQAKKRAKYEARQAQKAERKEREKRERAELAAARKEEAAKRVAAMTTEEALVFRAERRKKREDRQTQNRDKRERLAAALESGQRIIIDLDFADLMTDQELRSLTQQLSFSYAANARAAAPAHLHLTSAAGRMGDMLLRQVSGLHNWHVTRSDQAYIDLFAGRTDELVYLTADSPNELGDLDPGKAYIIGGIVDRNRHKNLCAGKAAEQGIATARLPVSQFFKLSASAVLTVNQVVEALLKFSELRDWRAALEHIIPGRKRSDVAGAGASAAADTDCDPDPSLASGPAAPVEGQSAPETASAAAAAEEPAGACTCMEGREEGAPTAVSRGTAADEPQLGAGAPVAEAAAAGLDAAEPAVGPAAEAAGATADALATEAPPVEASAGNREGGAAAEGMGMPAEASGVAKGARAAAEPSEGVPAQKKPRIDAAVD